MHGAVFIAGVAGIVFLCSVCAFLAALKLFPKLGLLDFPERYGLTRARLPYPTGIVAVLVFLLFFLLLFPLSVQEYGLLFSVIALALVSFIDDRHPLPFSARLGLQVLIALLLFVTGSRIYTITNPFDLFGETFLKLDSIIIPGGPFGSLPVISGLFTLVWLMLTMNALNWFDGIPGQVSALSVIGFVMLALLALSERVNQPGLALLAAILAAIALAALCFDVPPAKMLMGDSGSMFFGLMLGLLGIYQGGKVATAFLVLGVPLFDAGLVVLRRIYHRKSPFQGDVDHLHHRLLEKGWSPRAIIALTAALGTAFGVTALFLNTNGKAIALIGMLAVMLLLTWYSRRKI